MSDPNLYYKQLLQNKFGFRAHKRSRRWAQSSQPSTSHIFMLMEQNYKHSSEPSPTRVKWPTYAQQLMLRYGLVHLYYLQSRNRGCILNALTQNAAALVSAEGLVQILPKRSAIVKVQHICNTSHPALHRSCTMQRDATMQRCTSLSESCNCIFNNHATQALCAPLTVNHQIQFSNLDFCKKVFSSSARAPRCYTVQDSQ